MGKKRTVKLPTTRKIGVYDTLGKMVLLSSKDKQSIIIMASTTAYATRKAMLAGAAPEQGLDLSARQTIKIADLPPELREAVNVLKRYSWSPAMLGSLDELTDSEDVFEEGQEADNG